MEGNIPLTGMIVTGELQSQFNDMVKKGQIKFHQFYNNEIETDEFSYIKYMRLFKDNKSPKLLNKSYYDIEVYVTDGKFPEPVEANYLINAVSIYNNIKNEVMCFYVYDLKPIEPEEIKQGIINRYKELCEQNNVYAILNLNIEVKKCTSEKDLLIEMHQYIKSLDTLTLIGFNSKIFDDPYIMNRGIKLFGDEKYYEMVSDFQVTKYSNRIYEWPDYILVDLLELYQPVDAGGMGFGKSLPNYKLNTIAKKELGITKLDLEEDFAKAYENNLVDFLTYNILDAILVFKLDERLKFLELIFSLSQYNTSTMGAAINGRSIMYTFRNDLIYTKQNKLIRNKKYNREVFFEIENE